MANILCTICRDSIFEDNMRHVCSIPCGHLFHECCLFIWLKRSQTCPHCRLATTPDKISRLYFEIQLDEKTPEDDVAVRTRLMITERALHDAKVQIQDLLLDYNVVTTKLNESLTVNESLRLQIRSLNTKINELKNIVANVVKQKDEIAHACNALHQNKLQLEEVNKELDKYKKIRRLLEGTLQETDEILNGDRIDTETLKTLFRTLKRDLLLTTKSQAKLKDDYGSLYGKYKKAEKMISDLNEKLSLKDRIIETYKTELCSKRTPDVGSPGCSHENLEQSNFDEPIEPTPKKPKISMRRAAQPRLSGFKLVNKKSPSKPQVMYDGLGGSSKIEVFPSAKLRPCKILSNRKK